MRDMRSLALAGLLGLVSAGVVSVGCSSSSNGSGTGGVSGGTGGSSGGTGGSTGGSGGTAGVGGHPTGTGGSNQASGGAAAGSTGTGGMTVPGCAMSDPPARDLIADFTGDGGVEATSGAVFTYPAGSSAPKVTISGGALNVTASVAAGAVPQSVGVGISFSGNAAGTDCTNALVYTGVEFDISGSLTGAGCSLIYATNDTEHTVVSVSDPKASAPSGSFPPPLPIEPSSLTANPTTMKVPFTDTRLGLGKPQTYVDPIKLEAVQWQLAVPAIGDAGAVTCKLTLKIDNVSFYPAMNP